MKNLKELEQKYLELGKEIEALKNQVTKKEEIKYPIYCKLKHSSLVVKFTGLQSGEVVVDGKCYKTKATIFDCKECTDTRFWQQLDVCKETGFFDGQLVWCWDNNDTHSRELKFYDVKNERTYHYDGTEDGYNYENYEPFEGNYPEWALKAFQTLKR